MKEGSTETEVIGKTNNLLIILIAILFLSGIISANFLIYLPHIQDDNIWWMILYWLGILIVPVVLQCVLVFYYFTKIEKDILLPFLGIGFYLTPNIVIGLLGYLPQLDNNIDYFHVVLAATIISVLFIVNCFAMIYEAKSTENKDKTDKMIGFTAAELGFL